MSPWGLLLLAGIVYSTTANGMSVHVPLRLLVGGGGLAEWNPDTIKPGHVLSKAPMLTRTLPPRATELTPRGVSPANSGRKTSEVEGIRASGDGDGKLDESRQHPLADNQTAATSLPRPRKVSAKHQSPATKHTPAAARAQAESYATLPSGSRNLTRTANLPGWVAPSPPGIGLDGAGHSEKIQRSGKGSVLVVAGGVVGLALFGIGIASLLVILRQKRSRMAARCGHPPLNSRSLDDELKYDSPVQLDVGSLSPERALCTPFVHDDHWNPGAAVRQGCLSNEEEYGVPGNCGLHFSSQLDDQRAGTWKSPLARFTTSLVSLMTQSCDDAIARAMAHVRENDHLFAGPHFVDVVASGSMSAAVYTCLEYCGSRVKLLRAPRIESLFHDSWLAVALVTNGDLAPYTPHQCAPIVNVLDLYSSQIPEILLTHPLYRREVPSTSGSIYTRLVLLEYSSAHGHWTAVERVRASHVTEDGWVAETAIRKPGLYTLAEVSDSSVDVIGSVTPPVRTVAGDAATSPSSSADQSATTEAEQETTGPAPAAFRRQHRHRRGGEGGPGGDDDDQSGGGIVGEPQFKWPGEAVLTLHAHTRRDDDDKVLLLYRITLLRGLYTPDHYQLRILNAELAQRGYSTEQNFAQIRNLNRDDVIEVKLSTSTSCPEVHIPEGIASGELIPASDLRTATPLDYYVVLGLRSEPRSHTVGLEIFVTKIVSGTRYRVSIFPLVRFPLPPLTQDAECAWPTQVAGEAEATPTVITVPSTDDRDSAISIVVHDNVHTLPSATSPGPSRSSTGRLRHITSSTAPRSSQYSLAAHSADRSILDLTTPLSRAGLSGHSLRRQLSIPRVTRLPAPLAAAVQAQSQQPMDVRIAANSRQLRSGSPSRASSGYLSGGTDADDALAESKQGVQSNNCQTSVQESHGSQPPDSSLETAV